LIVEPIDTGPHLVPGQVEALHHRGLPMGPKDPVRVLVLGERPQGLFAPWQLFERNDCQCEFAPSHQEPRRLTNLWEFDIVLSALGIPGKSVQELIALLSGSRASLFCSLRVETGYWWLPVLRIGKECFGTAAFRLDEFTRAFNQLVRDIKFNRATVLS
jgi:hypothetical protein